MTWLSTILNSDDLHIHPLFFFKHHSTFLRKQIVVAFVSYGAVLKFKVVPSLTLNGMQVSGEWNVM